MVKRLRNPTTIFINKSTLALFSQLEAEEAGKRGMGGMVHDDFMVFLLHLYMHLRGDDIVLIYTREEAKKASEQSTPADLVKKHIH
jgi:hypothetical protein